LLEEWELLRDPGSDRPQAGGENRRSAESKNIDITRDIAGFRRLIRIGVFSFLQDVNSGDWESAASRLRSGEAAAPADSDRLSEEANALMLAFEPYFDARERFLLDAEGRSAKHSHWIEDGVPDRLEMAQVLMDPEALGDWEARFSVSPRESREKGRAVIRFESVDPIGQGR